MRTAKSNEIKTVYIASPYTIGDAAINVRESIMVADHLLRLGYIPFVPLLTHFWHFLIPNSYEAWVQYDNEWVVRCDCVFRLPGKSKGADREVELATKNNIPVFYSVEELLKNGRQVFDLEPKA